MKGTTIGIINMGHEYADFVKKNADNHAFHFDNCQFNSATLLINNLYDKILQDLNPSKFKEADALIKFGMLLHIVQDFYSHSNWVEMGRTDILDEVYEKWTILTPYNKVKGSNILVVEGDNIPPDYTLKRNSDAKIVIVNDNQKGLISGLAGNSVGCPSTISIGHYDPTRVDTDGKSVVRSKIKVMENRENIGKGLNKDEPSRSLFSLAKNLAIEQTKHEWCRLVNLVEQKYYEKGKEKLIHEWVSDPKKSPCSSNTKDVPKIQNTGSFEHKHDLGLMVHETRGTFSFTVDNGKIKGSGEAIYTITDFPLPFCGGFCKEPIPYPPKVRDSGSFKFTIEGFFKKHNDKDIISYKYNGVPAKTQTGAHIPIINDIYHDATAINSNTFEDSYGYGSTIASNLVWSGKTVIYASIPKDNKDCSLELNVDIFNMFNKGVSCIKSITGLKNSK